MNSWNSELARYATEKLAALGEKLFPGDDAPLQRQGNTWQPCDTPGERVFLPDGSDMLIKLPDTKVLAC